MLDRKKSKKQAVSRVLLATYFLHVFYVLWSWSGTESKTIAVIYWPIVSALDDDDDDGWYERVAEKPKYSKKACVWPPCPPQISHDFSRDRTRAVAMGSRRLTSFAVAWSYSIVLNRELCSFQTRSSHFSKIPACCVFMSDVL
jgi:hypothetical protein